LNQNAEQIVLFMDVKPLTKLRKTRAFLLFLFLWLRRINLTDVRESLPLSDWYGLRENGDLFPSFDLLK
jgi:hypothetical protein